MATHSSILAWRIPGTEESGGLQSMGSQRVRHDRATNTHTLDQKDHWSNKIYHYSLSSPCFLIYFCLLLCDYPHWLSTYDIQSQAFLLWRSPFITYRIYFSIFVTIIFLQITFTMIVHSLNCDTMQW